MLSKEQLFWQKCPFCGALNGSYGSVTEEHTVRCRWIGPANQYVSMHPNYFKKIAEDDKKLVPVLEMKDDYSNLIKQNDLLKEEFALLQAKFDKIVAAKTPKV